MGVIAPPDALVEGDASASNLAPRTPPSDLASPGRLPPSRGKGEADLDHLAFTPTREAGLARLRAFAPRAGRWYANHGGVDHGPERRSNTAGLGPWLACRLITPEEAVAAVEAEHGGAASVAFREEVEAPLRRRARLTPDAWRAHRLRVERLFRGMAKSPTLLAAYEEAAEGRTGIDAFDAWARELATVGWLHPAAHAAFASLWIFSLRLPWELGADLHHRSALDGEAAGLLLWREVAGLERGLAAYVVQVDEVVALSGRRFHPKRRLVEEQAKALKEPKLAAAAVALSALRATPPAELGARSAGAQPRTGWLLTEADLNPSLIPSPAWLGREPEGPEGRLQTGQSAPVAFAALGTAPHRSPFGPTEPLAAWIDGALADALARAAAPGQPAERLDDADLTRSLQAWAATHALTQIATPPPPAGPIAERLAAAARKLASGGVELTLAV